MQSEPPLDLPRAASARDPTRDPAFRASLRSVAKSTLQNSARAGALSNTLAGSNRKNQADEHTCPFPASRAGRDGRHRHGGVMRRVGLPAGRHQGSERVVPADAASRRALGHRDAARLALDALARRRALSSDDGTLGAGLLAGRAVRRRVRLHLLRPDADDSLAHGRLPLHRAVLHGARAALVRRGREDAPRAVARHRRGVLRHRARLRRRLPARPIRTERSTLARHRGRCARRARRLVLGRDDGRRARDVRSRMRARARRSSINWRCRRCCCSRSRSASARRMWMWHR